VRDNRIKKLCEKPEKEVESHEKERFAFSVDGGSGCWPSGSALGERETQISASRYVTYGGDYG
jgi:hypothetical protein